MITLRFNNIDLNYYHSNGRCCAASIAGIRASLVDMVLRSAAELTVRPIVRYAQVPMDYSAALPGIILQDQPA